jgi:hypothetical protein
MDAISKRQADRVRFLRALYEASDGRRRPFAEPDIAEAAGLTAEEASSAADYLKGKGLLRYLGGSGRYRGLYALTPAGVDEYERAHANPDRPTEHLPPWSIVFNIGTMNNSQIQAGTHGSTQSMHVTYRDITSAREFITSLAAAVRAAQVPELMRDEINADIAVVEAQVASPKPKMQILVPALLSIKTILESGLGGYIGAEWVPRLAHLLGALGGH